MKFWASSTMSMSMPMSSQAMPGSYFQLSGSSIISATQAATPSLRMASWRSVSLLALLALRWRSLTSRWMASVFSA